MPGFAEGIVMGIPSHQLVMSEPQDLSHFSQVIAQNQHLMNEHSNVQPLQAQAQAQSPKNVDVVKMLN